MPGAYSLGTLPEADTETLEEHLLVCSHCQERLTGIDVYVRQCRPPPLSSRAEEPAAELGPSAGLSGLFAWPCSCLGCRRLCAACSGFFWAIATQERPSCRIQLPPVAVILQALSGDWRMPRLRRAPEGRR